MHLTKNIKSRDIQKQIFYCLISFFFLIAGVFTSSAQNITNSPYSRFGLGDFSSITFARNLALGGSEVGLNPPSFINYGNPAAYSSLWFTTYEAGADFKQYELKQNNSIHKTHTSSLSYFDFAFPIKAQKWALGFGLLPYSKVGYSISESTLLSSGETETRKFEGSGGLNNFHIGTGFKAGKKASFGLNIEYLFGSINNNRLIVYNSPYFFNTEVTNSTSIGWFHFKGGFQYKLDSLPFAKSDSVIMMEKQLALLQDSLSNIISKNSADTSAENYALKNQLAQEIATVKINKNNIVVKKAKSDWHLVLGIVASPTSDLHATNSILSRSFRYYSYANPDNGIIYRDTIENKTGSGDRVRLPLSAGIGFSLLKGNRWLFCADYSLQQWSDFSFLGAKDSLQDSWKVTAGIQFTPNDRAIKSYYKLIQYRIGFHYEQGFLKLNGQNINDMGVTAGFGLPIRKAGTILHLSLDAGKRGTTLENLIQERYLKFTIGFTINDRWFVKPKYD